ncbi:MAG: hypothetical protein ACOY90_08570 [Candidatus Zhuqueibacterota bacterium]
MKKQMLIGCILWGLSSLLGCRETKLENQWVAEEVIVDGKDDEWKGGSLTYAEAMNLALGTANDAHHLYVMFRLNDPDMARKIQMMGVTVWLDAEGGKEKTYGMVYRGSVEMQRDLAPKDQFDAREENAGTGRRRPMMERFGADLPEFGKIRMIERSDKRDLSANNPDGPAAGSALSNGYYTFEFRLPLPVSVTGDDKMNLCLELGGMSNEEKAKMREAMPGGGREDGPPEGGRPGGGMGGRPGGMDGGQGGMRGGGRPGGMTQPGQGLEKQELWFAIQLAAQSKE